MVQKKNFKILISKQKNIFKGLKFYQEIENPGSGDYTLSTNFDGAGTSRVIITIITCPKLLKPDIYCWDPKILDRAPVATYLLL